MGKWIARLKAKAVHPLLQGTDETDETPQSGVLSVLSVPVGEGAANSSPAQAAPDLSAMTWTDADIDRFLARRTRLLRWGWAEPEAEALAERLVQRDRETDPRVTCAECRHYQPGRCTNHQHAGLLTAEVGRDLAATLQRCRGFSKGQP